MPAIAVSAGGAAIYLALENDSGFPVIVKTTRADLSTFSLAYSPGAGTAANVASVPSNPDLMLFYGEFGSGIQVLSHVVSTGAETNISPTGLTTKVVNTLEVDPSDANRIQATVDTDQDLLQTIDGGANWVTLNAALGFNGTGQKVFWSGDYDYDKAWLAGQVTGAASLKYTPNEGSSLSDVTGAALGAAVNVVGVEGVEL